ncbi:MAG: ribosomal protein S18-alanine N-acetyltransferase [Candidatus Endomicrobiellum trichonymphae]|nr:MAG: ribosomal protein S18-alanine N-acetyltransferase [Candidatus Endomicrobium trichonymphae]
MKIVNFSERFLDDITEIEKQSFANPWTKEMLLDSAKNTAVKFKVLIENRTVAGYYIISTVADETELLDIAVDPKFRRRYFGQAMLADIKKESTNKQTEVIFLEVRQSNNAAINLYKSFGFKEIGVRKKYYKNEDALVLRLINRKESTL